MTLDNGAICATIRLSNRGCVGETNLNKGFGYEKNIGFICCIGRGGGLCI